MIPFNLRIAAAIASLLVAFSFGWLVFSWKNDASILDKEREAAHAYQQAVEKANETGAKLQQVLSKLEENKFVVTKELSHETTLVQYRCNLPDGGRLLFNRSAESPYSIQPD